MLDAALFALHCFLLKIYLSARKLVIQLLGWEDRFFFPGNTHVSAPWLDSVLKHHGVLKRDNSVVDVICEDLSGNRGLCGSMTVLRVTYAHQDVQLPDSFVVKTTTSSKSTTAQLICRMFSGTCREGKLYSTFKSKIDNLPLVFYESHNFFTGELVVVMENLVGKSVPVNFYFGNQIWGMKALEHPIEPQRVMLGIYLAVADIHARYWRDPALLQATWMKSSLWYQGKNRFRWERSLQSGASAWKRVAATIGEGQAVKWQPRLVELLNASFEHTSWDGLQAHLHDPTVPFTLTHGDFHASNMLMRAGSSESSDSLQQRLVLVDWSEVGPWEPCADLGQTMVSDVKPAVRREHEAALVRAYWERLCAGGVSATDFPFEQCWESYGRASIERWLYLLVLMATFPGIPPTAVQFFHDQVWAFVEDHATLPYYQVKPVVWLF